MAKEYTKEQLWKLYEMLPEELRETIFSEETAENIYDICTRNKIIDDRISEVARYTGRVLMGILPPDEFQETLEKEIKVKKDLAKRVAHEINRFVFYPVKSALEQLYKIEITPPVKTEIITPSKSRVIPSIEEKPVLEEKPPTPSREDVYREPTE